MNHPDIHVAHIRVDTDGSGETVPHLLSEHLKSVATLAQEFACKVDMPSAGYLAGLAHDLGKYSAVFQRYILSANGCIPQEDPEYIDPVRNKGRIDHSTAGAQHIWNILAGNPKCVPMAQILALCVFSHHSGLQDCITPDGKDAFGQRIGKSRELTRLEECLEHCETPIREEMRQLLQPALMKEMLAALHRVHMRVASRLNEGATQADIDDNMNSRDFQQGLLIRFLLSCLLDADRINSAEFDDPVWKEQRARLPRSPWDRLLHRLETHLEELKPERAIDRLRRDVSEQCAGRAEDPKGLFTLTVPTGGGKTLASLRFAIRHARKHDMDRVVYVIPYTSIIDQNADVARRILEQDEEPGSIVLEHHSNILPAESTSDDAGCANQWEKLSENWEAPVVFTTMAQFLESLFGSGTRHARRMHNLANSVLIFDEIQTLPVRCMRMFCNAIDLLIHSCGASVVLCTATQPRLDNLPRPQLGSLQLSPEREIIADVPGLFAGLRRTEFFDHCDRPMSADETAGLALEELRIAGSCLVVCNTKSMAEKVYSLCTGKADAVFYYLSTNLCPAHRMERLSEMREKLEKGKPVLCVSTQLIECGVDISFGSVIRFAAGLDSILQAAGRCNRHGDQALGRVHVVKTGEQDEHLDKLADIREGRAIFLDTVRVGHADLLKASGNDLTRPEIVSAYFEHYFHRRGALMSYPQDDSRDTLLSMLGSNNRVTARTEFVSRQSFASAARDFRPIDSPATAVVVPHGKGKSIIAELCSTARLYRKKELLRLAQRYSVNVFPHAIRELTSRHALHEIQDSGILTLDEPFYCPETGVVTEAVNPFRASYFGQED